jgi:cyclic beta-1,2-glucan synthetase
MTSSSLELPTAAAKLTDEGVLRLLDLQMQGPIRAELLGLEGLESQARRLARECVLAPREPASSPLLNRFVENRRGLLRAKREILARDRDEIHGIDADWLADNFHIIDDVLREVKQDLPSGYDLVLPKLGTVHLAGFPRVYAIALTLVAHTDSELDETRINRFVEAFQEVSPLQIGELWALPTMFRLALLDNLDRLASEMLWGWDQRQRAERWCQQAIAAGKAPGTGRVGQPTLSAQPTNQDQVGYATLTHPTSSPSSSSDEVAPLENLSGPFVVRLVELLRDQGPAAATATRKLEDALARCGQDFDQLIRREHHRQAANQLTVGNCVISLRLLSAVDWNAFFERNSLVEKVLRDDPAGAYPLHDFATSDRYRKMVEKIARGSNADEFDVARKAIELARSAPEDEPAKRHVGYYLVDRGAAALKSAFGYLPEPGERLLDQVHAHPQAVYFGSIALLMAILLGVLGVAMRSSSAGGWAWFALAILVALLPASELAVGLVNHALTLLLKPKVLPKLDFKEGIPEEFATFVVMPSMLVRPRSAEVLCERLETHYLANPNARLRFALLTDFADADTEEKPEDHILVREALQRVEALNQRYAADGPPLFFLFHRHRMWNPAQNCWMGWERKRGKLSEFNRLIRGDRTTTYSTCSSDPAALPRTRFIVTLDADTQMPRDTVGRLIGTLAHPLNRPRFDPEQRRVVEGYGVLQPRVSFHLTAATHSRFAALLAASGGIDPYSSAASDAYMDLFGLGSFTGKGIYEVEAFEAATGETFPENHILSHDLIEGNYARCGLLSDTELFDDFPARYHAYARREHRWVRGDWQLLPWLGRRVPTSRGEEVNPLPLLERWKLLDNLRRSLVPPALLVMLALGWTILPGSPWLWTLIAVGVLALPLLKWFLGTCLGCIRSGSLAGLRAWRESVSALGGQILMAIFFLADQARLMCDAIARTLSRLWVSRQRLLEWETAAATEQRLGTSVRDFVKGMWVAPTVATVIALSTAVLRPGALWAAAPWLIAWFCSPIVAYWVSLPRRTTEVSLGVEDVRSLRRIARKTWHFFETFVGDEDHWLPPDNFQEVPDARLAHRTSPTNQGLLLVSTLAAHDLGYLSLSQLCDRLARTFDTFEKMQKHWGHFYNWYDTRTLEPLPPAYISTVDSGNLLGCLVTLKQGLREKMREPLLGPAVMAGLEDTFGQIDEASRRSAGQLAQVLLEKPGSLLEWDAALERLEHEAGELQGRVQAASLGDNSDALTSRQWAELLLSQVRERRRELLGLVPWLPLLRKQPASEATSLVPLDPETAPIWDKVVEILSSAGSLEDLSSRVQTAQAEISTLTGKSQEKSRLALLAEALDSCTANRLRDRLGELACRAEALGAAMDFRPLYKPDRHLYAIGANLTQGQLDGPCYDLLASESCLTSYLNVARGAAPRRHWFQLGRPYIIAAGRIGLISWGGTMFEYLMPRLLLRSLPGTLLAEAAATAVARQIEYGRQIGIPWGVSESAYNARYIDGDYHYQAFGVPGLGLKRGLERDRVVAPYATAMATMITPREALANLRRLASEGAEGPFGFYEAVDYTTERLAQGQRLAVCRSYMAHHQGMSLVALTNAVLDEPMPRRFHADPMVRAAELLLQERIPPEPTTVEAAPAVPGASRSAGSGSVSLLSRRLTTPLTAAPRTHLLSNTRYHVMVTNAGSGFSRCEGLDMTRWREDSTCETWGQYVYVRDLHSGEVWSAGYQPVCREADDYEVVFSPDKALFRRRDLEVETQLEITVSPEQLAEVRRITLANHANQHRDLELTSYVEPVLGPHAADLVHPAFGKLFLETEYVPASDALFCRRRPRSMHESSIWAVHVMAVDRSAPGCTMTSALQFETDRGRFVGRGRTLANPAALSSDAALSGTVGPVLDPVLCLRRRFRIAPGGSAVIGLTLAKADSRDAALALADKYHGTSAVVRAFELAWAHSQVEHGQHDWSPEDSHLYQRLGAHLLFAGPALRGALQELAANHPGQPGLARCGLAVDRPFILVRIEEQHELALARQLLLAHEFLRQRSLDADLVFLLDEKAGEPENMGDQLRTLVHDVGSTERMDRPGGIFLFGRQQLTSLDLLLLETAARVVIDGTRGPLASQLDRIEWIRSNPESLIPCRPPGRYSDEPIDLPENLQYQNSTGGFSADGRTYCLLVRPEDRQLIQSNGQPAHQNSPQPILPPAPWINVLANPSAGCLVSESGLGFTWAGNSQTNRLTVWSNDPVVDPPAEVIYLRDESTGQMWCPTPLPVPSGSATLVRHGFGYTTFEQNSHGIGHELTVFVPPSDPIKLLRLRVRNESPERRQLSATYYAELVLGQVRDTTALHLVTELDSETGALLARNAFRGEFAECVAFVDMDRRPHSVTADRVEFLGRHGSVATPAALRRAGLSGTTGAALDPCAAVQTRFELGPGESTEVIFFLGEAPNIAQARELIRRYRNPDSAKAAFESLGRHWEHLLEAVQVHTPEPSLDLLLNGWLLYQVISCRLHARSAFYQSGGAFGFRDQLQDVMALVHTTPEIARAQIVLAASRQFVEGDVQHWWHPPTGLGVRTRITDDLLWLVYVTCDYVTATGDSAILDEVIAYLKAPLLAPGQEDDVRIPALAEESGSLYEHCARAMEHALRLGPHGLPLIGTGDWNDGLNRVGVRGKGESLWLAWFLIVCLRQFEKIAAGRGDQTRSNRYQASATQLSSAIEEHGWDGSWYLRALFDDGTPLGSARSNECQIDSLAQSWAVISGSADPKRSRTAMESVDQHLVRCEDRLILLLSPPFSTGPLDPGYIKGYLPGIRENGAQYTHAASWVVLATAMLGKGKQAFELFRLLNPIHHATDRSAVERYKVEPYVVAGDIFSQPPHTGRGGWTWYTGSAAWLYRVGLQSLLGLERLGDHLKLNPCIPPEWTSFSMTYRYQSAVYHITIENRDGVERGIVATLVDDQPVENATVPLCDDGRSHEVRVIMGHSSRAG